MTGGDTGTSRWSGNLAEPVRRFLHTEAGSSSLLLGAAVVALVWANSPWSGAYADLWSATATIGVGSAVITESLGHWVNDGLMVFFFYVVGLEIRREVALGELRDRRTAAVPALAALGGMVVPVLLFLAINGGGAGAGGWGIVMATDIAFVLGALSLMGPGVPPQVRVFLLTLAIVDDIGAIVVIAVFYSDGIDPVALGAAAAIVAVIAVLARSEVSRGLVYVVAGLALWVALYESGVHPTIAGVLLGLLTPVHAPRRTAIERASVLTRSFRQDPSPAQARSAMLGVGAAISPNERWQELLHPWTSYVIVPIFALANAGVPLSGDALAHAARSPVTIGVVVGLVVGKTLGVALATALAVRLGLGTLPRGMNGRHALGAAILAGIGFTVSLFVTELAFDDVALRDEARIGVLAASILAAACGWLAFRWAGAGRAPERAAPTRLDPPVDPAHDHIRGPVDAPLSLVEYADAECPFCGAASNVVQRLRERYGDRLQYVFRHLPLDDVHPHARLASEAMEAAGAQGRFWEMHDRLLAGQDGLELDDLVGHAQALGIDVERFLEALRDRVHAAAIDADVDSAERSGVTGTPTFFVNGERVPGPHDAETLERSLDRVAA